MSFSSPTMARAVVPLAVITLSTAMGGGSLLALGWFLWVGSFQVSDLALPGALVLAWDAALSVTFFFQHSGMVRGSFRAWLGRFFPERFHAALYSVISGAVLLLVLGLWQKSQWTLVSLHGPPRWAVRTLFGAAAAGFVWGSRALGSLDAFGVEPILHPLRGARPGALHLTIRGPYRWVRHPLYTTVLVMLWACPDLSADRVVFNLLWSVWVVVGTVLEERDLVAGFGADYREYQKSVPMLVPRPPRRRR